MQLKIEFPSIKMAKAAINHLKYGFGNEIKYRRRKDKVFVQHPDGDCSLSYEVGCVVGSILGYNTAIR